MDTTVIAQRCAHLGTEEIVLTLGCVQISDEMFFKCT